MSGQESMKYHTFGFPSGFTDDGIAPDSGLSLVRAFGGGDLRTDMPKDPAITISAIPQVPTLVFEDPYTYDPHKAIRDIHNFETDEIEPNPDFSWHHEALAAGKAVPLLKGPVQGTEPNF